MGSLDEVRDLDIEASAAAIDRVVDSMRRGVVTPLEAVDSIRGTTSLFVRFATASAGDVDFVIQYARHAVGELAWSRTVMDPVLVEVFDDWLDGRHMIDELQMTLDALLEALVGEQPGGSTGDWSEIVELCRHGRHTHRTVLRLTSATAQILRAAYTVGCAEGLRDAVSPQYHGRGQLVRHGQDPEEFVLALDLLAHLAADPDSGAGARSALLDLGDFVEVAGEAVVRLPLHLLDDDDRARLLEIHERRVALFYEDPMIAPLGVGLLRDNRIVRSAVWQAFDARHLR